MLQEKTGMVHEINLNEIPPGKQYAKRRLYYNLKIIHKRKIKRKKEWLSSFSSLTDDAEKEYITSDEQGPNQRTTPGESCKGELWRLFLHSLLRLLERQLQ